jgi:hypothetical protein
MSNIDTTDYTFSNIDWSALPVEALAAFNQTATTQPEAPTATMTPAEAEAAAAIALGQPTGRPAVEAALPAEAQPAPTVPAAEPIVKLPTEIGPISQTNAIDADAVERLRAKLDRFGLGMLAETAFGYAAANKNASEIDILRSVNTTPEYKARFGFLTDVNKSLTEKGRPILTENDVVDLEAQYLNVMKAYNMPDTLYDQVSDFQSLIIGDVPPSELQERIQKGYDAVRQSSPEVIAQMKTLYDVDEAKLAAYFLDPANQKNQLVRQAEAVQVSAAAKQAGGIQLGATMAERLAAEGVTATGAREGFTTIAQQRGLFQPLMQGEQAISEEEQIGATFGLDAAARQRIETRRRRRQAEFAQGGGFAETAQGVIGLRTVGE